MREIRTHGSEGRESDLNRTSLPLLVINGRWPMLDCKRATSKSVSEDEVANQGIPRARFGLLFEPPTAFGSDYPTFAGRPLAR